VTGLLTRSLGEGALSGWRLRNAGYVHKWLVLGSLIGLVAGFGAVLFFGALQLGTHWLLGALAGFHPPGTIGEGHAVAGDGPSRPWAVPLVAAGGALVSGLLVFLLAPEAEGHGTDAAIKAVHHSPTSLRPRAALVKIVASAFTIGSGGSGGREGPTAQISAGFASLLARRLNLTPADARIAVSAGMASGIAAIFRAPLGGALLGAELLYRDDMEAEALLPSFVSSIVAFSIFGSFYGFTPIFGAVPGDQFRGPSELVAFALLGVVAGLVGRGYSAVFYRVGAWIKRLRVPPVVLPALGGLAVGLLGLVVPGVLGTGYGWVQGEMDASRLAAVPLWLVLVLPLAKIVATTFSIGSGGSGGIFGPGMVIGASTGAALWRVLHGVVPGMPDGPAPFVVVGMIACFGAVAHAPLAVMLMVGEMTGNLSFLAPAMIAVALASVAVGDTTIYVSQLRNRAQSPAARLRAALSPAGSVTVHEVLSEPRLVLPRGCTVTEALARLEAAGVRGAPVVNDNGTFHGSLDRSTVVEVAQRRPEQPVGQLARQQAATLPLDASLDAVAETLAISAEGWVPVLDDGRRVVGVIATSDLIRGIRLSMRATLRRLHRSVRGAMLVELAVEPGSPTEGKAVRDVPLPTGTMLASVQSDSHVGFPNGDTVLKAGDVVSAVVRQQHHEQLCGLFAGPA
jgi:H+/Cl- antiporter ClcA